jgi:hypothetical protein
MVIVIIMVNEPHDVLWLNVSMHVTMAVQNHESTSYLVQHAPHLSHQLGVHGACRTIAALTTSRLLLLLLPLSVSLCLSWILLPVADVICQSVLRQFQHGVAVAWRGDKHKRPTAQEETVRILITIGPWCCA